MLNDAIMLRLRNAVISRPGKKQRRRKVNEAMYDTSAHEIKKSSATNEFPSDKRVNDCVTLKNISMSTCFLRK